MLIPVLPESMQQVLSAPVPFVIGMSFSHPLKLEEINLDGVICDVDSDKVLLLSLFFFSFFFKNRCM